jgi:hypothetical protein
MRVIEVKNYQPPPPPPPDEPPPPPPGYGGNGVESSGNASACDDVNIIKIASITNTSAATIARATEERRIFSILLKGCSSVSIAELEPAVVIYPIIIPLHKERLCTSGYIFKNRQYL